MKIPEPLFVIINPAMRMLLRSPLHGLMSGSLLLITFKGRATGRTYTTPLRYLRDGKAVRCFTTRETRWWRNLKQEPGVVLRIAGSDIDCTARIIDKDGAAIRELLAAYLTRFPGDAVFHDVGLQKDRTPKPEDLDRAVSNSVVIEAIPN